jgi:hypothetical protein
MYLQRLPPSRLGVEQRTAKSGRAQCTSGIVCVVEGGTQFRGCGVSGLQLPQDVSSGTVCRVGALLGPRGVGGRV